MNYEIYLNRSIELAEEALNYGNEPFGSLLVDVECNVLFEDYNRISSGDATEHPEIAIAKWAAAHLTPEESIRLFLHQESIAQCVRLHMHSLV